MIILNIFLLFLLILLTRYMWSQKKFYWLCFKLPGLWGFPFIGIALKLRKVEDILRLLGEYHSKAGEIMFAWLGPRLYIMVIEPKFVEKILTNCFNKAEIYSVIRDIIGDGLFSAPCPKWNNHRKLLNPTFSNKILMDFFPIFNEETNILKTKLDQFVGCGETDLTLLLLQKTSLNIASRTTMGKQMVSSNENDNEDFFNYFKCLLNTAPLKVMRPWYQIDFIFQLSRVYPMFITAKKAMQEFVSNLIQNKIDNYNVNNSLKASSTIENDVISITKEKNIFINQALDLAMKNQFSWEDVEIESMSIIFGAFDTTSSTIFHTLVLLAMFPEYQEKLYEEIVTVLPDKESDVKYEHLQEMKYMEMVMNEVFRLMPAVPVTARTVDKDLRINDDLVLPKGLQVVLSIFHLHRNPNVWGPNANIFNPENMSKENLAGKHPYAFIPFSKGIRNCIGWRYAQLSIKIAMAKILRNFRFTTKSNFNDLEFMEEVALKLKKNPLLEIHRRDN